MDLTFSSRDMIRTLRVLAPALSRGHQDQIYTAHVVARGSSAVVRALNDTREARSAIPTTIETPGEVWLPGDTVPRLPWGSLGERVRMRRARTGLEIPSQSPTSETFTAETMGPAATKGLPQGTKAATIVPGTVFAKLLQLGSIATLGKDRDERAVLFYTSNGFLGRTPEPTHGSPGPPLRSRTSCPLGKARSGSSMLGGPGNLAHNQPPWPRVLRSAPGVRGAHGCLSTPPAGW